MGDDNWGKKICLFPREGKNVVFVNIADIKINLKMVLEKLRNTGVNIDNIEVGDYWIICQLTYEEMREAAQWEEINSIEPCTRGGSCPM